MTPKLFSKPGCVQCQATVREFDNKGVEYQYVDLMEEPQAIAEIKELGYMQAPVVFIDDEVHWSGFRPDLINKHLLVA